MTEEKEKLERYKKTAYARVVLCLRAMIVSILLAIWIPLIWKVTAMFAVIFFAYVCVCIAVECRIKQGSIPLPGWYCGLVASCYNLVS